jgi:hypothetical protein
MNAARSSSGLIGLVTVTVAGDGVAVAAADGVEEVAATGPERR